MEGSKVLQAALDRYPENVPSDLHDLDRARYEDIPAAVADRDPHHLTKDECITLVKWKLKHGTWRPNLLKLAQSNTPEDFVRSTTEAFALLHDYDGTDGGGGEAETKSVREALKTLTALKGIGPAIASLFLSCRSDRIPFFSDELFRLTQWPAAQRGGGGEGGAAGWGRKIGYTPSEYQRLFAAVSLARRRLRDACGGGGVGAADMTATQLERAAWVLGQEGADAGPWIGELLTPGKSDEGVEKVQSVGKRGRAGAEESGKGPEAATDDRSARKRVKTATSKT